MQLSAVVVLSAEQLETMRTEPVPRWLTSMPNVFALISSCARTLTVTPSILVIVGIANEPSACIMSAFPVFSPMVILMPEAAVMPCVVLLVARI